MIEDDGILKARVIEARLSHIHEVLERSDAKDIKDAPEILRRCIRRGLAWEGLVTLSDGIERPACIWGLEASSMLAGSATLWLITTDIIKTNPFLFVRHSQMVLEKMFEYFPTITAYVECSNVKGQKWMKWLGGRIGRPMAYHKVRPVVFTPENLRAFP